MSRRKIRWSPTPEPCLSTSAALHSTVAVATPPINGLGTTVICGRYVNASGLYYRLCHVEVILGQSFREFASVDNFIEISCKHYLTILMLPRQYILYYIFKQSSSRFSVYHVFAGVMYLVLVPHRLLFSICILFFRKLLCCHNVTSELKAPQIAARTSLCEKLKSPCQ